MWGALFRCCVYMYAGASEVCRQSMESGTKYGQRKRTKEIIAWAKKKRRHIRREELLAFLLDKPYPDSSSLATANTASNSPMASPRRRALLRDDPPSWNTDGDMYSLTNRENGTRKRTASSSGGNIFDFNMLGSDCKRMRYWYYYCGVLIIIIQGMDFVPNRQVH